MPLVLRSRQHKGYWQTTVRPAAGRKADKMNHQLIAQAFHGPRPTGMICRHLDGNKLNNRADNLAYGTHAQNHRDSIRHGTSHHRSWVPAAKPVVVSPGSPVELRKASASHLRAGDLESPWALPQAA